MYHILQSSDMALFSMDYWQSWLSEHCAVRLGYAGFMNSPFRKDESWSVGAEPWLAGQQRAELPVLGRVQDNNWYDHPTPAYHTAHGVNTLGLVDKQKRELLTRAWSAELPDRAYAGFTMISVDTLGRPLESVWGQASNRRD
ncbi:hypothetical protein VTN00DRAFT_1563 [Thermoascus crustaceus]|uniref:uncharacterized protein n=1 Tax=Thermoascus crustaceus TaxID=5088 RepID=UPI0037443AC7